MLPSQIPYVCNFSVFWALFVIIVQLKPFQNCLETLSEKKQLSCFQRTPVNIYTPKKQCYRDDHYLTINKNEMFKMNDFVRENSNYF